MKKQSIQNQKETFLKSIVMHIQELTKRQLVVRLIDKVQI